MFSPKRWNRADLIITLALLLAVSLCCPALVAIDDEDNDLPPVILPLNKPGGNGGCGGGSDGNRSTYVNPLYPSNNGGLVLRQHVAVVFDAPTRLLTVNACEDIPGLQISGRDMGVTMTLAQSGSSSLPQNPDASIGVTAPAGTVLKAIVDDDSFVIRNHYALATSLDEILEGIFLMDLNAGQDASSGAACIAVGDLGNISVKELHLAVLNGSVESKAFLFNDGSMDLTGLIRLAEDDLRNGVFDIGVIMIGYDEMKNVVSVTNVIIAAEPSGYECPVEIQAFTLN